MEANLKPEAKFQALQNMEIPQSRSWGFLQSETFVIFRPHQKVRQGETRCHNKHG